MPAAANQRGERGAKSVCMASFSGTAAPGDWAPTAVVERRIRNAPSAPVRPRPKGWEVAFDYNFVGVRSAEKV